jgi:hypothetical protein
MPYVIPLLTTRQPDMDSALNISREYMDVGVAGIMMLID